MSAKTQKRLHKALDRLEAAAHKLAKRAATGATGATGAPRGDRQRADYQKLREDYAALERVTETATARLDNTIARLKGALEG